MESLRDQARRALKGAADNGEPNARTASAIVSAIVDQTNTLNPDGISIQDSVDDLTATLERLENSRLADDLRREQFFRRSRVRVWIRRLFTGQP